jgi:hypothetical protein
MSNSESSDVTVKYQSNGKNLLEDKPSDKKPQSTDTDYYLNMLANPIKVNTESITDSESSSLGNLLGSEKSSTKSKSSDRSSKKSTISNIQSFSPKQQFTQSQVFTQPTQPMQNISMPQMYTEINTKNINPEVKILSSQEMRMKKIELLRKLCEIKAKGYQLSKEYDFNSSLEEMEYEYELLKSFADKRNGVKIFKNGLLQAVSVIEFLNDRYDPFDFHLSGWGEHMSVEVDSWEDVLEEIYEKYKGTGRKMAPEIKLLYLIIASASAFHFSKSQAAKLPGLDSVLSANPGLLSKIIGPGKRESSQFMTPQELNIEKQKEELKKKEKEAKIMQQQQINQLQEQVRKQNELIIKQQNMINQKKSDLDHSNKFISSGMNVPDYTSNLFNVQAANAKKETLPPTIPIQQLKPNIPDIRAPENVKDILNRIHNLQPKNKLSNTETQDDTTSNNDRLVSEITITDSNSKRKQPKRQLKKANISII